MVIFTRARDSIAITQEPIREFGDSKTCPKAAFNETTSLEIIDAFASVSSVLPGTNEFHDHVPNNDGFVCVPHAVGGLKFIRAKSYDLRTSVGLTLGNP